jgi:hypothetical protein
LSTAPATQVAPNRSLQRRTFPRALPRNFGRLDSLSNPSREPISLQNLGVIASGSGKFLLQDIYPH